MPKITVTIDTATECVAPLRATEHQLDVCLGSFETEYNRSFIASAYNCMVTGGRDYPAEVGISKTETTTEDYLVIEQAIKIFVYENYGQAELENPSWDIAALANHIREVTKMVKPVEYCEHSGHQLGYDFGKTHGGDDE